MVTREDCQYAVRIDHSEGPGAWHEYVCELWFHENCDICRDYKTLRKNCTNVEEMRKEFSKRTRIKH